MRSAILSVLLAGFALTAAAQDGAYLVQPGDRLEVSVLEDPGLNRIVLVRPDGRISLPLAGTLVVQDRSPEAVAAAVRRALAADFVQPPTVTVSLVGIGSSQGDIVDGSASIYVIGQVGRPGVYQVALPIDALQALALAGGPSAFAAVERIQVRRRTGGGEQVLLLNYELVEDGLVPSALIGLADGDVIVVPERGLFE